jgi:hypothetical protein
MGRAHGREHRCRHRPPPGELAPVPTLSLPLPALVGVVVGGGGSGAVMVVVGLVGGAVQGVESGVDTVPC